MSRTVQDTLLMQANKRNSPEGKGDIPPPSRKIRDEKKTYELQIDSNSLSRDTTPAQTAI